MIKNDLPFYDRMLLMIDASDNAAANSCFRDIGFLFIHSSLWQADFFNPKRGGGMWLSLPYGNPMWAQNSPFGGTQVASPASTAAFMTLLATYRIVSPVYCQEMLWLLDKNKLRIDNKGMPVGFYMDGSTHLARSYFKDVLHDPGVNRKASQIYSKIGLLEKPRTLSDCVYIVRKEGTGKNEKTYRYVASFINYIVEEHGGGELLGKLIIGLDECIKVNNP